MRTVHLSMALGVVLALSADTRADDLNPPAWRGQDNTTLTSWEFLTSSQTPTPDFEFNPYGSSSMVVYTGVGQSWQSLWGGREGVWPLSGAIDVDIPNNPDENAYKDIWIQLTWTSQVPGGMPYISDTISGVGAQLIEEIPLEATNEPEPVGEYWVHSTYLIHIEPNPPLESLRIGGSIMVDELVVDTICIPEPASFCLIGFMGLMIVGWRRK